MKSLEDRFVDRLNDILSNLQSRSACENSSDHRISLGEKISRQIALINETIFAARGLGIIPQSVAKFSNEKRGLLVKEFRSLIVLEARDQIRMRFKEILLERGISNKLLLFADQEQKESSESNFRQN